MYNTQYLMRDGGFLWFDYSMHVYIATCTSTWPQQDWRPPWPSDHVIYWCMWSSSSLHSLPAIVSNQSYIKRSDGQMRRCFRELQHREYYVTATCIAVRVNNTLLSFSSGHSCEARFIVPGSALSIMSLPLRLGHVYISLMWHPS